MAAADADVRVLEEGEIGVFYRPRLETELGVPAGAADGRPAREIGELLGLEPARRA